VAELSAAGAEHAASAAIRGPPWRDPHRLHRPGRGFAADRQTSHNRPSGACCAIIARSVAGVASERSGGAGSTLHRFQEREVGAVNGAADLVERELTVLGDDVAAYVIAQTPSQDRIAMLRECCRADEELPFVGSRGVEMAGALSSSRRHRQQARPRVPSARGPKDFRGLGAGDVGVSPTPASQKLDRDATTSRM
jgi:hypothetical protein